MPRWPASPPPSSCRASPRRPRWCAPNPGAPGWCCRARPWPRPPPMRMPWRWREGLVFIHPYDDPAVIAGQGTLALEMLEDAPALQAMLFPVGGGGMLAGCAGAIRELRPGHRRARRRGRGLPRHGAAPGRPAGFGRRPDHRRGHRRARHRRGPAGPAAAARHRGAGGAGARGGAGHRPAGRGRQAGGRGRRRRRPRRPPRLPRALRRASASAPSSAAATSTPASWPTCCCATCCGTAGILRLHLDIPDRPGVLADIATRVAAAGGNVIEVSHQRLFAAPSVQIGRAGADDRGARHRPGQRDHRRAGGRAVRGAPRLRLAAGVPFCYRNNVRWRRLAVAGQIPQF